MFPLLSSQEVDTQLQLPRRMRRLRTHPSTRALLQETRLHPSDFMMPCFVTQDKATPIPALPGQWRLPVADLIKLCARLQGLGIGGVCLFPHIDSALKSPEAEAALDPQGLIPEAIRALKAAFPQMVVMSDLALDPYTDHGHDGLLDPQGRVVNDPTVERLCQMACLHAACGADWVGPSDMMDGRVQAIRQTLDRAGFLDTLIISYSAKFASSFYGPFRQALGNSKTQSLDKRGYQLNPANRREALLEAQLDEDEGADILMVKPAGPYLDIIRELRTQTRLPIAAYQVSGEYAQIHLAAQAGLLDLPAARLESLLGIKRAGADVLISYFALSFCEELAG